MSLLKSEKDGSNKFWLFKCGEGFKNGQNWSSYSQSYTGKFTINNNYIMLSSSSSGTSGTYNPTGRFRSAIDFTDYERLHFVISSSGGDLLIKISNSTGNDYYDYSSIYSTYRLRFAQGVYFISQDGSLDSIPLLNKGLSIVDNHIIIDIRSYKGSYYLKLFGIGSSQNNVITDIWLD